MQGAGSGQVAGDPGCVGVGGGGGGAGASGAVGGLAAAGGCGRDCFCVLTGMPCIVAPAAAAAPALTGGGRPANTLVPAAAAGPAAGLQDATVAPPTAPAGTLPPPAQPPAGPLGVGPAAQLADAVLLEGGDPKEAAEYAAWLASLLE